MKFQTKYNILLWKSYFDKGLGVTAYIKYFIGFFALASMNVNLTMWLVGAYAIFCFILGYCWFKYGWIQAEIEIGNRYNLFVNEMRRKFKRGKYID